MPHRPADFTLPKDCRHHRRQCHWQISSSTAQTEDPMTRISTLLLGVGLLAASLGPAIAADAPSGVQQSMTSTAPAMATVPAGTDQPGTDPAGQRYTHALNFLEANGYTGILSFSAEGQDFDATVWHDGKQVSVRLDPSTGAIQNRG
jgi:hypothetical protein